MNSLRMTSPPPASNEQAPKQMIMNMRELGGELWERIFGSFLRTSYLPNRFRGSASKQNEIFRFRLLSAPEHKCESGKTKEDGRGGLGNRCDHRARRAVEGSDLDVHPIDGGRSIDSDLAKVLGCKSSRCLCPEGQG
jgi:hypothetical protein